MTYFLVLYYFPLHFMNIEKRFQRLMEQNISINKQIYLITPHLKKNLFFLHPENTFSPTNLKTATRKGTILQFLIELFLYQRELMEVREDVTNENNIYLTWFDVDFEILSKKHVDIFMTIFFVKKKGNYFSNLKHHSEYTQLSSQNTLQCKIS